MFEKGCKIGSVCVWGTTRYWYEDQPPIIWIPNIELADPNSYFIEESKEGKLMTIQNVRNISALHNTLKIEPFEFLEARDHNCTTIRCLW